VSLYDVFQDIKNIDNWDLNKAGPVTARSNAQFKWNIYSE
jgi:hypothetical protein